MKPAVFGPPVPIDSRWRIPYGGLSLSVAVAAWRRDEWLLVRSAGSTGRPVPALPTAVLTAGEPPMRAARRLLRSLGFRPGTPLLAGVHSHKARRGHWEVTFVFAAPVMGRTRPTRHAAEPDFRPARDPAVASACRALGVSLAELERRLGSERRRQRPRGSPAEGTEPSARSCASPAAPVPTGWAVDETRDLAALRALLAADPIAHAELLGTLEAPAAAHTRFFVARRGGELRSLIARVDIDEVPLVIAAGAAEGVRALLRDGYRPLAARFHLFEDHVEAARAVYHFTRLDCVQRLALAREAFRAVLPAAEPVELHEGDAEEVCRLYLGCERPAPGAGAVRAALRQGPWLGIRECGRLAAVAGTVALCAPERIALLGGAYTHPEQRGRGFARTLVAGLARRLFDRVERLVVDVVEGNATALALCVSLGFAPHGPHYEGTGARRE